MSVAEAFFFFFSAARVVLCERSSDYVAILAHFTVESCYLCNKFVGDVVDIGGYRENIAHENHQK
jgi:hypothetical protein